MIEEHSLHLLLISAVFIIALSILYQDKFKSLTKLKFCTFLTLTLFIISFVGPCHLIFAQDQLSLNPQGQHSCCLLQMDTATSSFQVELAQNVYQSPVEVIKPLLIIDPLTDLNNKSPPTFS